MEPFDQKAFIESIGSEEIALRLQQLFISSSCNCIKQIKMHKDDTNSKGWFEGIHELKGTALQLGAHRLAKTCESAQDCTAINERNVFLKEIIAEVECINLYITKLTK